MIKAPYMRASSLKRLRLCPGSFIASLGIKSKGSPEAAKGTRIHRALYLDRVKNDADAIARLEVDEQDVALKLKATVDEIIAAHGGDNDVHGEVEMLMHSAMLCGHADLVIFAADDTVHVVDYKTGWGEQDEADVNDQLEAYAVLVAYWMESLYPDDIHVHLVTVRGISSYVYTPEMIETATQFIMAAANECMMADAPRRPSPEACRYCPAFATPRCPESVALLADSPLPVETTGETTLAPATLARLLPMIDVIERACEKVRSDAKALLDQQPDAIPGWTLKPGATRRVIENAQAAYNAVEHLLTADQFAACCNVSIGAIESAIQEAKGMSKAEAKNTVSQCLRGIVTEKQNASSLIRAKEQTK